MATKKKRSQPLNLAVDSGFADADHFEQDEDFVALRDDDRFQAIESKMSALEEANDFVSDAIESANQKEYDRAAELCHKALQLDPNHGGAILNLGYALHMQDRLDDALVFHQRASESKRYAALANYNLCCVSARKNQTDAAFEYLDKAIDAGLAKRLDMNHLDEDSDLTSLRSDKRFDLAKKAFAASVPLRQRVEGISFSRGKGTIVFQSDTDDFVPQVYYPMDDVAGNWQADVNGEEIDMLLRCNTPNGKQSWGIMNKMKSADFVPPLNGSVETFVHENKFGTISFTGMIENGRGTGTFQFEGSENYRKSLADRGITNIGDAVLFRFNFGDIDEEPVLANLKKLQELEIPNEARRVLMLDGVQASLVQDYLDAKLSVKDQLAYLV